MRIKRETRERVRYVTGFVIALGVGAVLAALGFLLPPALQDSSVGDVPPELRAIALAAVDDVERAFFADGVEQYLVTIVFVATIENGPPATGCPDETAFHARVRARTAWWIPYDNALWCGDETGAGIFVTRQA